jgi:hypothetical protein
MMPLSAETVREMWWITLAIYGVVVVVVAVLLTLILQTTKQIRAGVSDIWNVGQKVANNTIHISLLDTTNHVAGQILASAGGVAVATGAIRAHAENCPGCPSCVIGGGRS